MTLTTFDISDITDITLETEEDKTYFEIHTADHMYHLYFDKTELVEHMEKNHGVASDSLAQDYKKYLPYKNWINATFNSITEKGWKLYACDFSEKWILID